MEGAPRNRRRHCLNSRFTSENRAMRPVDCCIQQSACIRQLKGGGRTNLAVELFPGAQKGLIAGKTAQIMAATFLVMYRLDLVTNGLV